MVFLQKLLRVVHHPTIALAVALATFLIAAGAGSLWTSRVPHSSPTRRYVALAVAGIVGLGALLCVRV